MEERSLAFLKDLLLPEPIGVRAARSASVAGLHGDRSPTGSPPTCTATASRRCMKAARPAWCLQAR